MEIPTARHDGFTDICSYQPLLPTWIAAIKRLDPALDVDAAFDSLDFPGNCNPPTMGPRRLHDLSDGYGLAFLDLTLHHDVRWRRALETPQAGASYTSSCPPPGPVRHGHGRSRPRCPSAS